MRAFILVGYVALTIVLASCGSQAKIDKGSSDPAPTPSNIEEVNGSSAEATEGDFVYRLVSEKEEYRKGEPVKVYGELEYIGDKESVTIYHSASPFYFPIVETTRNYSIYYMMDQPLLNTTLKRGEPLREEYKRGGGYGEQDEKDYVDFIKSLWEDGFPEGHYVVDGYVDFYVQANTDGEDNKQSYKIQTDIDFQVKE
jgi:hypothetical protein